MRRYNADPAHKFKVKFYGMDMQIRDLPGNTTPSLAALDEALTYLNHVNTALANQAIVASIKVNITQFFS